MSCEENLVTDVETFYFHDMFLYPEAITSCQSLFVLRFLLPFTYISLLDTVIKFEARGGKHHLATF